MFVGDAKIHIYWKFFSQSVCLFRAALVKKIKNIEANSVASPKWNFFQFLAYCGKQGKKKNNQLFMSRVTK